MLLIVEGRKFFDGTLTGTSGHLLVPVLGVVILGQLRSSLAARLAGRAARRLDSGGIFRMIVILLVV